MATKKKATTKAPKTKRPPKQVWITYHPEDGVVWAVCDSKSEAKEEADINDIHFAGPYVLAERARNR